MARVVCTLAVLFLAIAATEALVQRPTLGEYEETKASEAEAAANVTARDKKMAAVDKAITLLSDLQAQVLAEGEKEAAAYNKFACFCKDTTSDKSEAIQKGEDEQMSLTADIKSGMSKRDDLDVDIAEYQEVIKNTEKAMAEAEAARAAALKEYTANDADLRSALYALENAIKTLKAGKTKPSLLQFQSVSNTLRTAVELADALGVGSEASRKSVSAFLQQPANGNQVEMEDYKFHSDDIVATLEGLEKDFTDEKTRVDAEEVASVHAHNTFMEESENTVKQHNKKIADASKAKQETIEGIELDSKRLSTVEATLLDDKEYLKKLSEMCNDKAQTWDQRSRVRQDELSTLTQAIGIVKDQVKTNTSARTVRFHQQGVSVRLAETFARDPDTMSGLEALAEEADEAPALIQVSAHNAPKRDGVDMIRDLLMGKGKELKSTLLTALASKITGKGPFAKIKTLIQELIERLLQEAGNEANQKGWCDKATADATQKRTYAAEEIATLNSEMATLEAARDQLLEELGELAKAIQELKDAREKAEQMRQDEKAENTATVEEAQAGLDALNLCMTILDRFYKTVKKESVDLSLAQQSPAGDAPDTGFKIGEAYTGAQSEAGGILGMLEVMKSDFARTISETEKAEAQAEQDHLEFMTESGKSLAEKEQAETEKTAQKDDVLEKLGEADDELGSQTEILKTSISELMQLKATCIDTGMSYAERVARREEEIAALHKALCILGNYAEYGPDGAADGC